MPSSTSPRPPARSASPAAPASAPAPGAVLAPFPGVLSRWLVEDGAQVAEGETLLVLEAMKMESPVTAAASGRVSRTADAGATVRAGEELGRVD